MLRPARAPAETAIRDRVWLQPSVYAALLAVGARMDVSLNVVRDEKGGLYKRRAAFPKTQAANLGLAAVRCGVRYLDGDAWVAWERVVHAKNHGAIVKAAPGGLWISRLAGTALSQRLAICGEREAVAALTAAFAALGELHREVVTWPDGVNRELSHSDATARNALWDAPSGRASWVDFETIHERGWCAEGRRLDDLRALVFSSATVAEPELVVRAMRTGYPDRELCRSLPGHVRQMSLGRALFHMSQAPLPRARLFRVLISLESD